MLDQIFYAFLKVKTANKTLSLHMSEAELRQGSNPKSEKQPVWEEQPGEHCKTKIKFVKWVPLMKWEVNLIIREHQLHVMFVYVILFDLYCVSVWVYIYTCICVRVFFLCGGLLCGLSCLQLWFFKNILPHTIWNIWFVRLLMFLYFCMNMI